MLSSSQFVLALVSGFTLSTLAIVLLLRYANNFALDHPNQRSLHDFPVPRTGGWAIVLAVATSLLILGQEISLFVWGAFLVLLVVSAIDDLRGLSSLVRLVAQFVSAGLVIVHFFSDWPLLWQLVLSVVIVWSVNLFNFMDGLDGFAGSMAVVGFTTLAIVAQMRGDATLTLVSAVLVASCIGFLRFNWPGARLFLGDAGSTFLGLTAVVISLDGVRREVFSPLLPLLVFLPFWLDASLTLTKRILSGQRWWEAHREHFYQRVALKHGKRFALYLELGIMLALAGTGLTLARLELV
ncbi:hypothetical protein [Biformimicrobium ophioploci]|uniref:Glycosyl transferase n=1 Tax=Biformimicrobium ophioploci TaxID=3036711 RepID=A0ABQ6M2C6_9GAMM|nr:hypothetical protein [Microbulbifer sp. NKW57]GMG88452.1 glycosyl transferase [Microbulbifer sp. NKW57]